MVIKDFCCFLSFVKRGGDLFASTLSTLKPEDYKKVDFNIKLQKDKCKTKYTLERAQKEVNIPVIMGSRSQKMWETRMELTDNSPDLMEISEYSFDNDAMEID